MAKKGAEKSEGANEWKPQPKVPAIRLSLDKIRTDGGTQTRVKIDEETVGEYAEDLLDFQRDPETFGPEFPPITVFEDEAGEFWLADGFHRVAAYRRAGQKDIPAYVHKGSRQDAVLHSCGANSRHGLRRNHEDKRNVVRVLLANPEWAAWNDSEIARATKIPRTTVQNIKKGLGIESTGTVKHIDKHGNETTMNTAKMGGSRKKPVPEPEPEPAEKPETSWEEDLVSNRPTLYTEPDEAAPSEPEPTEAGKAKKSAKRKDPEPNGDVEDGLGNVVPSHLRDVFADQSFETVRKAIDALLDQLNPNKIAGPLVSRMQTFRHLRAANLVLSLEKSHEGLIEALETVEAGRPFAMCPSCRGSLHGCLDCLHTGVVPRWKYDDLTGPKRGVS